MCLLTADIPIGKFIEAFGEFGSLPDLVKDMASAHLVDTRMTLLVGCGSISLSSTLRSDTGAFAPTELRLRIEKLTDPAAVATAGDAGVDGSVGAVRLAPKLYANASFVLAAVRRAVANATFGPLGSNSTAKNGAPADSPTRDAAVAAWPPLYLDSPMVQFAADLADMATKWAVSLSFNNRHCDIARLLLPTAQVRVCASVLRCMSSRALFAHDRSRFLHASAWATFRPILSVWSVVSRPRHSQTRWTFWPRCEWR